MVSLAGEGFASSTHEHETSASRVEEEVDELSPHLYLAIVSQDATIHILFETLEADLLVEFLTERREEDVVL